MGCSSALASRAAAWALRLARVLSWCVLAALPASLACASHACQARGQARPRIPMCMQPCASHVPPRVRFVHARACLVAQRAHTCIKVHSGAPTPADAATVTVVACLYAYYHPHARNVFGRLNNGIAAFLARAARRIRARVLRCLACGAAASCGSGRCWGGEQSERACVADAALLFSSSAGSSSNKVLILAASGAGVYKGRRVLLAWAVGHRPGFAGA